MIRINLAPARERKAFTLSMPSFNLGILFGLLSILAVVVVGGWWWMLTSERDQLERDVSVAEKQLETLKAAIAEGNHYKAERDDLEKRVAAVEELTKSQPIPIYFLEAVAGAIPSDVWLTSTSEKERQFHFNGTAFSSTALADFMSNLRASGKFKDVDLVVARQDISKVPRMITFEVVCRLVI
jgi:type IV pilus assembly protein PilN